MEAATLSRTPPRSGPVQVGLIASLLVVPAGSWAETGNRMGGMDAGPGTELDSNAGLDAAVYRGTPRLTTLNFTLCALLADAVRR